MSREATQFKPGQSGNPGGRPKKRPITDAILKELRVKGPNGQDSHLQLAVWKLVQLAIAGDVAAFKELANRVEGTPVQPMEHSGPDGGEIVVRRYVGVDVEEV